MEKPIKYPFKFLDSYSRDDQDIFFGRDDEVELLYQMVFQTDLILVYGASGSGKTSLIQCGLAGKFQPYEWMSISIRRGANLNESLDKALQLYGAPDSSADENDHLGWLTDIPHASVQTQESSVAFRLKNLYLRHFKPVYLIFDQFEELYILGNKEEHDRFVDTIRQILLIEQPVKIIISIREEYLGYLYEFERKVPELLRKKLRLEPMNLEKVQTVVKGISQLSYSNVRLQKGEEERIAEFIFEKLKERENVLTIELPYLQVFMDELYLQITGDHERKASAELTLTELMKIGDIGDILRNFLDAQVLVTANKLDEKPEVIWRVLSPFVTLEGTKDPLAQADLALRLPDTSPDLIAAILQSFVNSRILRYSEDEQRFEIAHDSLARQIHARRDDEEIAILEVQRLIKSQTALKVEAREYFSEKQLLFIEPFLSKFRPGKEELEWIELSRAYLREQKEAEQRRQKAELERTHNRLRLVRGLLFASVIALVAAGYFAIDADRQKRLVEEQKARVEKALLENELNQKINIANELKNYGDNYWDLGKKEHALIVYRRALEIMKDYPDESIYKELKLKIEQPQ